MKTIYFLFLGVFSLALGTDAIEDRENHHSNFHTNEVKEVDVFLDAKKKYQPVIEKTITVDQRAPQEIKALIKHFKKYERGCRHFNSAHYSVIAQLEAINFFQGNFPPNDKEALKILAAIFTPQEGQSKTWDAMTYNFVFERDSFMEEYKALRKAVAKRDLERNVEIKNILDQVYEVLGASSYMIVYYWNNTP